MLVICKLLILCLSLLGYVLYLDRKTGLKADFIPVVLFSSMILLMFFAGLLNVMPQAVLTVMLAGLALLVYMLVSILRRGETAAVLCRLVTPGTVFFLLACCYFTFILRDLSFNRYDEFSHWGLVARDIYANDRLPNFSSDLIQFQAYPPGSALWIYFVTRVTGFSESMAYIAQSYLAMSCACALFAFVRLGKNGGGIVLAALSCAALAVLGNTISFLYVDNLVAMLPLANLAVIVYYRRELFRAAVPTLLLASATVLVKNSGMFFALIDIAVLLAFFLPRWLGRGENKAVRRAAAVCLACALLVPLACNFLWGKHVELVYPSAGESKHAMSAEHYESVFKEKTPADIRDITEKFVDRCFDFKENRVARSMLVLNGAVLLLLLLSLLTQKSKGLFWLKIFAACNGVYLVYTAGIWAMYLFSMPLYEAVELASFTRYSETGLIFVLGVFLIAALFRSARADSRPQRLAVYILSAAALAYPLTAPAALEGLYKTPKYEGSLVERVDRIAEEIPVSRDCSYAVYYPASATDAGYAHYLVRYKLQTDRFTMIDRAGTARELAGKIRDTSYLLVLEEDPEIRGLLSGLTGSGGLLGGYETAAVLRSMGES